MAASFAKKYGKDSKGLAKHPNQYGMIYTMTGESAYTSGGTPNTIDEPIVAMIQLTFVKYLWGYSRTTNKFNAYRADDKVTSAGDGRLVEATATSTNMSTEVIDFLVIVDQI